MHGMHEVDQNEMIIGFPSLRSVLVLNASPLAFSTVTDGTCAAATALMRIARHKINLFMISVFICNQMV
jgi:hypothetical protein